MNKINLGKLHVSTLSERELNNVFGGVLPTTTKVVTNSAGGSTTSKTGADSDTAGDRDTDIFEDVITF